MTDMPSVHWGRHVCKIRAQTSPESALLITPQRKRLEPRLPVFGLALGRGPLVTPASAIAPGPVLQLQQAESLTLLCIRRSHRRLGTMERHKAVCEGHGRVLRLCAL